jgi:hypothetical protein
VATSWIEPLIDSHEASMQEPIGCLPRFELAPGIVGSASDQKENICEILCDMITSALSESAAAASG